LTISFEWGGFATPREAWSNAPAAFKRVYRERGLSEAYDVRAAGDGRADILVVELLTFDR